MGIISNSCVSGYLYRDYFKVQYPNPFIWSYIDFNSFVKLMVNYTSLNYQNVELRDNHLIIDDKVDVHYLHYIEDARYTTPTFISTDNTIRYNNIHDYILTKYYSRLKRMRFDETTIFIMAHSYKYLTLNELEILNHITLKYPLYIYNNAVCPMSNCAIKLQHCNVMNNNKTLTDYIFNNMRERIASNDIAS